MRSVRVLSAVTAFGAFCVLVLGKIVRLTGASTSIPDWPLAFGRLVPEMTPLVFWEWSHRLCVLIVFVAMVALTIRAAWVSKGLLMYCVAALVLLLVPAAIGGVAVQRPVHWIYLAIDFASAVLFFASMVGLAVWSRMVDGDGDRGRGGIARTE
jgi:heme a synthase